MIDGQYIGEVIEAEVDEFLIDIPAAVVEELGLENGDNLYWTILDDGTVTLSKPRYDRNQ
jgi:hypothetical protein